MQKGFILFVPKLALKNISLVSILKKGEICQAFRPMGGNRQQNEEVDSGGTIYITYLDQGRAAFLGILGQIVVNNWTFGNI